MQTFNVGDTVTFKIGNELLQDTIKFMDCDVIEGEKYDLTHVKLEPVTENDWEQAGIKANECIEDAKRKAEELYMQKALQHPELYKQSFKDAFILFYIEGYAAGFIKNM
jgi:hypothetical protein